MPEITLRELAEHLGATLVKGEPERKVRRLAGLGTAGPGDLSFHVSSAYDALLSESRAEKRSLSAGE